MQNEISEIFDLFNNSLIFVERYRADFNALFFNITFDFISII